MKIVIAVQDIRIQGALRLLLEEETNTQIKGAAGADGLIELLDSYEPELAILSLSPAATTAEAPFAELLQKHPQLKIVALVGTNQEGQRALAAGAAGVISRSERPDRIMSELHRVLGQSAQ